MKWARLAWQRALRVKTCSVPETGAKRFLAQVTTSGDAEMLRAAEIARYQENGQLTPSFRLSAETIARILGLPPGKAGVTVRDYCIENDVEFSTVKDALQEAAQQALSGR